jgi:hypothetical protein
MKRLARIAFVLSLVALGAVAGVSAAQQYPMVDQVAQKVVQRYQTATCEQLWEARGKPKTADQQWAIEILRQNPGMQKEFLSRVAVPVAEKLFECGLIP